MKNFLIFLVVVVCYWLLTWLSNSYITTEDKIFDFLAKDYPSSVVENYMQSQRKYWWVSYVFTFLLIGIKVLLVAFCLNFVKIIDIENYDAAPFGKILFFVIFAEVVFIIAGGYKFVYFRWLQPDYTLQDVQTYYPMSLLNLFQNTAQNEKWLAYPLQLCNLFEVGYWLALAAGLQELAKEKISYIKSFGLVAATYGVGLLFWTAIVCFLILNAQY